MRRVIRSIPVLSTESEARFDALRSSFRNDIKPRDTIDRMYCDDFAALDWEKMRLRRAMVATLNFEVRNALYELLVEKLSELERGQETVEYLDRWFVEEEVKREVSEMLAKYNLDASVIEAERDMNIPRVSPERWLFIKMGQKRIVSCWERGQH